MQSYIDEAKNNIRKIVEEILSSENCDIRLALVEYRDHPPQESSFVTRCHDFTYSVRTMRGWLSDSKATGGGDTPEAVADGLHALLKLSWRDEATKIGVCISDAPPHGLGCHGDGFPDGCPDGLDPVVVTRQLAERGITLYVAGCEPAITPYKDFFLALAFITGGQYVPMTKSQVLSIVITGGAREELSLNKLMAEVDAEVKERVKAGKDVNSETISGILHARWTSRGESVVQLQMNETKLDSALESPEAKSYSKMKTLAEVRQSFKAKPGATSGASLFCSTGFGFSASSSMARPMSSSGGAMFGSGFCFGASTSTAKPTSGSGEILFGSPVTAISYSQSARLVQKSIAKNIK
jgi:hypothetical protein